MNGIRWTYAYQMLRPPAIFSYLVPRTQAIRLLPSRQRNEKRWTAQEKTTKETHVGGVLWSGVEKPKLTVEKHYKAFRASNQYFNQPPPFLNACRQSKQTPGPLESPCCDTERPKQTETSKLKVSGHARRRKLQRTPNTYPLRAECCHAEIRIV